MGYVVLNLAISRKQTSAKRIKSTESFLCGVKTNKGRISFYFSLRCMMVVNTVTGEGKKLPADKRNIEKSIGLRKKCTDIVNKIYILSCHLSL